MKKHLKTLSLLIAVIILNSCNNKKEINYLKTPISENYEINLPDWFKSTDKGIWEYGNYTLLDIRVIKGSVDNLKKEIEEESKKLESIEMFTGKELVNTESFEKGEFKGEISYYEKENKSKGLGLLKSKSYIIIGFVQDKTNRIKINSISLDRNINEELSKSIKTISTKNPNFSINKFDEEKLKKEGFQVFKNENFIIKCQGKLELDKEILAKLKKMEESGQVSSSSNQIPLHTSVKNTDYTVSVTDMTSLYRGLNENTLKKYQFEDINNYENNLNNAGIQNERGKLKNIDCVYYQITQNGKLTKAVFFESGLKGYLLQVTSKKNTENLFSAFVNTFEVIE